MHRKAVIFLLLGLTVAIWAFAQSQGKIKVLLIGLDGASWNVIEPLLQQNKLPNIKNLIDRGCNGDLETHDSIKTLSEVIWTKIATGKTPEKHGITAQLMRDEDTGELGPPTRNMRRVKAVWNILDEYNKSTVVVGYLVTWPPEEITRGVIISDRTAYVDYPAVGYTYPSLEKLCDSLKFKMFKNCKEKIFSQIEKSEFPGFIRHWDIEMIDNFMAEFSNYLMSKRNPDFFVLCLLGIDRVSHHFWKYMKPDGFEVSNDQIRRYGDIIKDYYIYCDRVIGDLVNKIDKNTIVVVVSDHGFTAAPPDHKGNSGEHFRKGIIIISGKHICHRKIESASVYDIAPTILYLMGLPVAKDMDGSVLTEAIRDDFLKRHSIKYIESYEVDIEKKEERPIRSPHDEEIKERMRSLGYIN